MKDLTTSVILVHFVPGTVLKVPAHKSNSPVRAFGLCGSKLNIYGNIPRKKQLLGRDSCFLLYTLFY